jgi:arylsulfatase A
MPSQSRVRGNGSRYSTAKDLTDWTPKFAGHPLGHNPNNIFRVEDGLLKVSYEDAGEFKGDFGHLFYKTPYSHYRIRAVFRFTGEQQKGGPPPNIIFILSDDIAQGDLGCYGQKLIQTPRLDRMAAEGTRFTQAYCGTSVCAPSRASLITGLHTGHCPIRGNWESRPKARSRCPPKRSPSRRSLKAPATPPPPSASGAWASSTPPAARSSRASTISSATTASATPTVLFPDLPLGTTTNRSCCPATTAGGGQTYAQELIQKDMIRWLKANADKPFFLFYAITLPHGARDRRLRPLQADKPWSDEEKAYAAQVTRIDSDVGELLDTAQGTRHRQQHAGHLLRRQRLLVPARVEIGKRFNQAANGLRGFKRGLYEGALRQACIARWPGTVPAGRVDDEPWAFWDLMPTFVEMSGAKPPQGYETDGPLAVDYLKGGKAPEARLVLLGTPRIRPTDPSRTLRQLEGRPQRHRQTRKTQNTDALTFPNLP